ncbi:hypothetical protein EIN_355780 [Entamoeba invadens IP1]|uniref:Uncharacterized protein n=1 Tax=Entamoeba invadens IP1 TaxID=370355 RepID=L7FN86_ENTIV|nr:hypothetical protein EIN_355780 [Entamoeba invadens IP1]ELP92547.1 hypothetical protein EIN_355780 [Entamoeba invadens IP1]|eukprot:XP_004259318.1 hypothetical protein EIN_355780 [Entamoeba invadens IP1]
MKDLSESTFELDDINIITLKLYECRNIKIYLNTTLKNLYVENGYGGDFECRKGVIYLTSFDSFNSGRFNSKNIVVDYLIPYKETVEQGPAWADSVVYSFNYMKGMYFVKQGFSSSEVTWSNPDPTGKPTYPPNKYILNERVTNVMLVMCGSKLSKKSATFVLQKVCFERNASKFQNK